MKKNKITSVLIGVGIFIQIFISLPAQALGGSCRAHTAHDVAETYGMGRCSHLNRDTKARVTLDLAAAPDLHSSWFTRTNTWHFTPSWNAAMLGGPRSARVDLGRR